MLLLFLLTAGLHPPSWPAARPLDACTISSTAIGSEVRVHVVGTLARRRLLGKKLAFCDLQDESSGAELQVLLKAPTPNGGGPPTLSHPLHRHALVPGARLACLGTLRADDESAKPTLLAEEMHLVAVAPCDNGVSALVAAVQAGRADATEALDLLCAPGTTSAERDAAWRLLNSSPVGSGADDGNELRLSLVAELQVAASARTVALARSGGGHVHAGLMSARQVPGLAFLYSADGQPGLAPRAQARANNILQGGATAAAAALDAVGPISVASALVARSSSDEVVVVEGEVGRRQRMQDDLTVPSRIVLLGLLNDGRSQGAEGSGDGDGDGVNYEDMSDEQRAAEAPEASYRLLRCLMHPAFCAAAEGSDAVPYALDVRRLSTFDAVAAQGARVRIAGYWAPRPVPSSPPVLIVCAIRLVRCASVPRVVRAAIDALADSRLTDAEAAEALQTLDAPSSSDSSSVPYRAAVVSQSKAERSWYVAELATALQRERPSPQLGGGLSDEQNAILSSFVSLRGRYPLQRAATPLVDSMDRAATPLVGSTNTDHRTPLQSAATPLVGSMNSAATPLVDSVGTDKEGTNQMPQRRTLPAPDLTSRDPEVGSASSPDTLPSWSLRAGLDGSYWSRKKRPQLLFMTAQMDRLLRAHPEWGTRPMRVVDIGGGKGLLAEHLARTYGDLVRVTLVEIVGKRLQQAKARMSRDGSPLPSNMQLLEGDAAALIASGELKGIDFATGLHACGGLTDLIVSHAVEQGAGFAVCSCCFNSNQQLPLPHGQPRNEWLARGSEASAQEVRVLMRTAELSGSPDAAGASAHTVNAMRAAAAEQLWAEEWAGKAHQRPPQLSVQVVEHEAKYSARNLCIVGSPQW